MSSQHPQPYGHFPQQPTTGPHPSPGSSHRASRRIPLPLLILIIGAPALLIGAVLGAAGTLLLSRAATPPEPPTIAVSGSMTLRNGFGPEGQACEGEGGYDDIREGTQVIITDATGVTLAVDGLGAGTRDNIGRCVFPFSLSAPGGRDFYGIEVSHRGRLQYSADQISSPLFLTLGD